MSTTGPYRAVLVGLGNIAWKLDRHRFHESTDPQTHAGAYFLRPDVELVGGCSPDESDRAAFQSHFHLPAFCGLSELLDNTQPDIASICSPIPVHFSHVKECLDSHIPMIWLEKPACVSTDELLRLGQYSLGRPTTILVNYIRRYVSVYRKLKDVFDQKLLGPPVCLQIIYSRGLLNNGAHLIDQAFFLAGDPQRFRLLDVSTPFDSSNPWFSMMLDQFVPVSVIGCPLPYHCIDLVLVCEEGRASIVHGGMTALWESKTEHELFPGFYRLKQESTRFLEPSGLNGAMAAALDDLIDAHRRKRRPISDLATAAGSQAVIEEALCKAGACQ